MAAMNRARVRRTTASERKWWIAVAVMIVVVLFVVGTYRYFRDDPRLTEVRKLQADNLQKMFLGDGEGPNSEDRQTMFRAMQESMAALPETERQQAREEGREKFLARVQQEKETRLEAFYALPTEPERVAYLDLCIDNYETRQKVRDDERAQLDAESRADRDTAAAGQSGSDLSDRYGTTTPRGNWADLTPEQRKARTRQRLDATTPAYRARRAEFIRQVQQRRRERGLPPVPPRELARLRGIAPLPAILQTPKAMPTPPS